MTETLTDYERALVLADPGLDGERILRIIDGHAADRAALVAQLEAAEGNWQRDVNAWAKKAVELTRELDEARADDSRRLNRVVELTNEVRVLTEALAAAVRGNTEGTALLTAADARVRELETQLSKMQSAPADMLERAIAAEQARNKLAYANLSIKADHVQMKERVERAEAILIANSSHWASEALRALRGQEA